MKTNIFSKERANLTEHTKVRMERQARDIQLRHNQTVQMQTINTERKVCLIQNSSSRLWPLKMLYWSCRKTASLFCATNPGHVCTGIHIT